MSGVNPRKEMVRQADFAYLLTLCLCLGETLSSVAISVAGGPLFDIQWPALFLRTQES